MWCKEKKKKEIKNGFCDWLLTPVIDKNRSFFFFKRLKNIEPQRATRSRAASSRRQINHSDGLWLIKVPVNPWNFSIRKKKLVRGLDTYLNHIIVLPRNKSYFTTFHGLDFYRICTNVIHYDCWHKALSRCCKMKKKKKNGNQTFSVAAIGNCSVRVLYGPWSRISFNPSAACFGRNNIYSPFGNISFFPFFATWKF